MNGATFSTKMLTAATKTLKAALNALITLAIAAVISKIIKSIVKAIKAKEEARKAAIDSAKALEDENDYLDEQKQKILELRTALDSGNLSQAEAYDKRQKLLEIQNEIIKKYGKEATSINLVTGSIDKQIESLSLLSKRASENWLITHSTEINDAVEYLNKARNATILLSGAFRPNKELKDFISAEATKLGGSTQIETVTGGGRTAEIGISVKYSGTYEQIINFYESLSRAIYDNFDETDEEVSRILGRIQSKLKSFKENQKYTEYQQIYDTAIANIAVANYNDQYAKILKAQEQFNQAMASGDQKRIDESIEALKNAKSEAIEAVKGDEKYGEGLTEYFTSMFDAQINAIRKYDFKKKIIESWADIAETLRGLTVDSNISDWTTKQKNAYETLADKAELAGLSIADLNSILVELGYMKDPVVEITKSFEDLTNELDNLQSAYSSLLNAVDEYNESGYISIDNFKTLLSLGHKYLQYLTDENGKLVLTESNLKSLIKARIDETAIKKAQSLVDMVTSIEDEAEAMKILKNSIDNAATSTWSFVYAQIWSYTGSEEVRKQLIAQVDQYKKLAEAAKQSIGAEYAQKQIEKQVKETTKALQEQAEAAKNAAEKMNSALKSQGDAYVDAIEKTLDRLNNKIDEINKKYDKQKQAIEDKKKALNEEAEVEDYLLDIEKRRIDLQKALTQKNVRVFREGVGFVWEVNAEAVRDAQEAYDKALKAYEKYQQERAYDKELELIEQNRDKEINSIKEEINKWEELKKSIQDNLRNIGTALSDHQYYLDELAKAESMSFDQMASAAEDYARRVIEAMQQVETAKKLSDEYENASKTTTTPTTNTTNQTTPSTSTNIVIKSGTTTLQAKRNVIKKGITAYANGTLSTRGGTSLVNEKAIEAVVTPAGTVTSLPSKWGVLSGDVTKFLTAFGQNPLGVLSSMLETLAKNSVGMLNTTNNSITNYNDNSNNPVINIENINVMDALNGIKSLLRNAYLYNKTHK